MSFPDLSLTESPSQRRAKIVATLGPATQSESVFRDLVRAGIDVVRLNFSHGAYEEKLELIKMCARSAAWKTSRSAFLRIYRARRFVPPG